MVYYLAYNDFDNFNLIFTPVLDFSDFWVNFY